MEMHDEMGKYLFSGLTYLHDGKTNSMQCVKTIFSSIWFDAEKDTSASAFDVVAWSTLTYHPDGQTWESALF